jgi:uncharacterized membrane protein YbhN (UPF0104 family)
VKKYLKPTLALIILAATLGAFIHYAQTHPAVFEKLKHTSPLMIIVLVACYLVWFLALVVILRVSLRMYGKTMPRQENVLLNAYATLINFFGPGQSGPALRGLYLKKRHGLPIKSYIFATLLYYGFYAVISAFLLCIGSQAWWKTLLLMVAAAGGSLVIIRWYAQRSKLKATPGINLVNVGWLGAATTVQMLMQCLIFSIELQSVNPGTSVSQTLTYTGAANFALFVALTPGAIGIREAFLVFSQSLHHLSNTVIVAANVIDRAVYVVFLGVLFVLAVSLHAKDKLRFAYYTRKTGDQQ